MPPLQQPCNSQGTTIICLLNDKDEKEEDNPEYYDIRYANYQEALDENEHQKICYFGLSYPQYKFKLNFELPVNLYSLSLVGCKIKTFNIDLPKNLINLNLSKNHLRKIPDNLPNSLLQLDVSNNNIRRVWKYPPVLEKFNCKNNSITKIPDTFPESIKKVNLSYNKIEILPKEIPKNMNLLEIHYNRIDELPVSIAHCQEIEVQWEGNIVEELPVEIDNALLTNINDVDYKNFIINKNI